MSKTIKATFADGADRATASPTSWQYDYGQILKIEGLDLPEFYEVHFTCMPEHGLSKTMVGDADGVVIPDEYLQHGLDITAFIYLHEGEDDGETEYRITIPVARRARPINEAPTVVQKSAIAQAIAALTTGVRKATEAADEADAAAKAAGESETEAKNSEEAAALSKESAEDYAKEAKSYAVGGTGSRTGEDADNAKYYKKQAEAAAARAGEAESVAIERIEAKKTEVLGDISSAKTSSIAAIERKETDVLDSLDAAKDEAVQTVTEEGEAQVAAVQEAAAAEVTQAEDAAKLAQSYAKGGTGSRTGEDTDNAKYYKEQADLAKDGAEDARDEAEQILAANSQITDLDTGKIYRVTQTARDGFLIETFTEVST